MIRFFFSKHEPYFIDIPFSYFILHSCAGNFDQCDRSERNFASSLCSARSQQRYGCEFSERHGGASLPLKKGPGGGCSSSPAATSGNNDSAEGSTGGRATSSENEQSNAATLESQEAENDPLALAGRWRLCLTASESGRLTFWSDQADTVPPTFREYASPPLPSEGNSANGLQPWSAPQVTLPLPFGLRAEGSATLGGAYGGWPNADWELSLEPSTDEEVSTADTPTALSSSGSRTSNGFFVGQFELPFAPTMPPPVTVLALDGQLMVTAETKRGKGPRASRVGIPGCEVWIRDNCPVKL